MTCNLCRARDKDGEGSDRRCAFENGYFTSDNWNCATVNLIRDLCYEGQPKIPQGVDYQYCSDQKYATINISEMEDYLGLALWVSWYKNRGATGAMWILDDAVLPCPPTEHELLRIAKFYDLS